jgi:hypothetical protein
MTTTAKDLEAEYQRKKAEIRADSELSWEQQEKAIKALGDEYHVRQREPEEAA